MHPVVTLVALLGLWSGGTRATVESPDDGDTCLGILGDAAIVVPLWLIEIGNNQTAFVTWFTGGSDNVRAEVHGNPGLNFTCIFKKPPGAPHGVAWHKGPTAKWPDQLPLMGIRYGLPTRNGTVYFRPQWYGSYSDERYTISMDENATSVTTTLSFSPKPEDENSQYSVEPVAANGAERCVFQLNWIVNDDELSDEDTESAEELTEDGTEKQLPHHPRPTESPFGAPGVISHLRGHHPSPAPRHQPGGKHDPTSPNLIIPVVGLVCACLLLGLALRYRDDIKSALSRRPSETAAPHARFHVLNTGQ